MRGASILALLENWERIFNHEGTKSIEAHKEDPLGFFFFVIFDALRVLRG
jgi:hypothetical protein